MSELPPGELMRREIAEQPVHYERFLQQAGSTIRALRGELAARDIRFVLLAARGSSDHAALYAKYLVEVYLRLPAGLVSPSTATLFGSRPALPGVLFLGISQSGRSPDLVDALSAARNGGAFTVAITNDADSELAGAAHRHLFLDAGPERSVAATKTYTAELLALYLLLAPDRDAVTALPALARTALEPSTALDKLVASLHGVERIVTTGRSFSYPTAREAALKLMETCYLSAQAFSTADLQHGPVAMLDEAVPVLAFAPPGVAESSVLELTAILRERAVPVTVIGPDADLDLPRADLPEALWPLIDILPAQALALELALSRGLDPDRPRGLSKVTRTH